jgi:hypothetical protein
MRGNLVIFTEFGPARCNKLQISYFYAARVVENFNYLSKD